MAFVFYDTETTGTQTFFDQILQFAAIRTDADLNEIERFEIRCRLHGHMAPSPGAMRVTGVTVAQLTDMNLPSHYEMVRAIQAKLESWSPAIFVGFNSMDFDEPLLRQALYQTLHNPYLTNMAGNCRADAMDLIQNISHVDSGAVNVPFADSGKVTFKLDRLAPANGFNHQNAHDALADVEATIHMCRLAREKCPDAWSSFTRFSQKAAVIDYISGEPAFVYLVHFFNKPCVYAMTLLEMDSEQSSVAYVFDLAVDLPTLAALDDAKLGAKLKRSPKPLRRLKANEAPFLMSLDDIPDHIRAKIPSEGILDAQLAWLQAHPEFVTRVLSVYRSIRDEYEEPIHLEQKLYAGFLLDEDKPRLEAFHAAAWEDRLPIVLTIADDRYRELGLRLIHAERPELLPPEVKSAIDSQFSERLLGGELGGEPWLTLPEALMQTHDLLEGAEGGVRELLADLANYLSSRIEQLGAC